MTSKRRRERKRILGAAALGLAACNGAAPPPPTTELRAPPPIATASSSATAQASPACHDEARREAHGAVRLEGDNWLVEEASPKDTRIWERTPGGPILRARVESSVLRFLPRNRLGARLGDEDFAIVDLAAGKVQGAVHGYLITGTADFLFVGDDHRGRRLRAADLAPAGTVAWNKPFDGMRGQDDARALDGGNALIVGSTLASFATGRVLQKDMLFGAPRADGRRVAACDPASRAIVEIDAATGAVGARFPLRLPHGGEACGSDANSAYADDHTIFWFERSKETPNAGFKLVVAAGDTRTGKVTRFEDPAQTWSIGFSSYPYVEDGHLCTTIASFHASIQVCDWILSGGRIVRSPKKPAGPSIKSLGLTGAVEVARAVSPSKGRVAVLTYRRIGRGDDVRKADLRLTIATSEGKKERSIVLEPDEVAMADASGRESGERVSPAELAFFDEETIGLLPGAEGGPRSLAKGREYASLSRLVDARTGVVKPLCGDDPCYRVGGLVALREGKLLDPRTGRSFDLTASEAAWAAALRVQAPCR